MVCYAPEPIRIPCNAPQSPLQAFSFAWPNLNLRETIVKRLDQATGFSQYTLGRLAAVQYVPFPLSTVSYATGPISLVDMYSYTQAGLPAAKRLQVNEALVWKNNQGYNQGGTGTDNLDSTYTYNNEGKVTAMTYPTTTPGYTNGVASNVPGASYNYTYDSMYRLSTMTTSGGTTVVNGVSYNAANQLLGMTYNGIGETRGYNVLNQLTSIVAGSTENLTYTYPAGPNNNGKVSSMYNAVSGETVTYTYDSLTRMATAAGSGWGEAYTFDGFGNLTTKHVTAGSGPSLSVSVNPANNQIEGLGGYDLNGNAYLANVAYDVENHIYALVGESPYTSYSYDAQGKRIFLWGGTSDSNGNPTSYSVVAYSPGGQKLGTYQFIPGTGHTTYIIAVSVATSDQYFGGRRLAVQDQLGSAGTYFPWGEAKGSTNPQDTWSYATYWRDSATGLDYANNRYYSNAYGRFMTPDSAPRPRLDDPQSWNRYAYTGGDPVNRNDPQGTDWNDCGAGWVSDASLSGPCQGPDDPYSGSYGINVTAILDAALNYATQFREAYGDLSPLQLAGLVSVYWNSFPTDISVAFSSTADLQAFIQVATPEEVEQIIIEGRDLIILGGAAAVSIGEAIKKFFSKMQPFNCPQWQRVPTPQTQPNQFQNKKNTPCMVNTETGEVWCKDDDLHGGEVHYSVYKNGKAYDNGTRDRTVWWNGCLREQY